MHSWDFDKQGLETLSVQPFNFSLRKWSISLIIVLYYTVQRHRHVTQACDTI